ncbi:DUF4199 domain-containing protein [Pedobacter sp. SYSU D00535]|uniref:DUF4199 domain-containing protein n=1 Tax=Pedobacter sp. SYSU D00535 TaxID=2810308 RepID=UPI001A957D45|nr:DUF4199 domain-containing protein [Pedobacter sp. SYSU D00535]
MQFSKAALQKKAAVNGLIFGAIQLVVAIISLYILASTDSAAVILSFPLLLSLLLPLGIAVYFCLNLRKSIGGYWSLREATSGIFIMFVVAYFLYSLGTYAFTKTVNPGVNTAVKENVIKVTSSMMERQGMATEQIDEKVEQIRESMDEEAAPGAGKLIQGIVVSIIVIFVVSLIFAAIFKREAPYSNKE